MNEEDTLGPSVVNDHQQPSETLKCLKRNLIKLRRQQRSPTPQTLTSMPTPLQVETNETNNKHDTKSKHLLEIKQNVSPEKIVMPCSSVCNMCCRKDDLCVNLQHNHATVLTVSDITRLPSWDIRQILSSVCSRCLVYISAITESSTKLRTRCEQAMYSHSSSLAPPTPDTSPNNFLQVTTTLPDDEADHSNNEHDGYALDDYCNETANNITLQLANSTSPAPPPIIANTSFDTSRSRSPTPSNAGQNSMLKIHYEQPVSPLNTESGGGGVGGKNNKRSYQRVQVIPVQMICSNCNRAYWRKDYYRKHVRRCSAKYRYAKSVIPNRSRSASRLELDAISVVSETNERITTTHNQPRVFRCNICTVTVDNISKLRQHKRIHMTRYYCDICNNEFTSQNEYDFHRVQCLAKMEVFEKGLENIRNEVISPLITPARRKTRSYSRALSMAPSVETSKDNESNKTTKTRAKRSKTSKAEEKKASQNNVKKSAKTEVVSQKDADEKATKEEPVLQKVNVKKGRKSKKAETHLQREEFKINKITDKAKLSSRKDNNRKSKLAVQQESNTHKNKAKRSKIITEPDPTSTQNDDVQSTITNYVKRNKHLYTTDTRESSIKVSSQTHNINKENEAEDLEVDDHTDDDDEDDDDVSEADTLYSKRLSLTNHWVEEHSISSHSHLSLGDNYIDEYMDDIPFRSLKEYDLYLLDRLKIEVKLHTLTCFVPHCKFSCATLNEMMVHDYICHFKRPWFFCRKCGYRFTSKVFLDYHLDLQNKGRYVCYKCGGHFEYQHQLDRHLIQHNRMSLVGGEKYICHYCNFKFLDEDKLIKHCHDENHEWNKKRKLIEIDHTMTITNKLPQKTNKQQNKQKEYQVKILNMVLKIMPSKRCTPIEKYRSHLPPYLRIPNRIGEVEFRHPSNPNCVGCL